MELKQFSASCTLGDFDDRQLDTIAVAYAKVIQEEIDNEIMVDMFKIQGWTIVKLPRLKDMMHAVDVEDWCVANAGAGKWNKFGSTFMFKESKHAEWFMLRWT